MLSMAWGSAVAPVLAVDGMSAREAYDAGVGLVQRGKFEQALEHFLAARDLGDQSARLQFNLGVTYYRLGKLAEARKAFLLAASDPDTRDLAIYNVGLVALSGGDRAEASRRFRTTAREAKSQNLRALAAQALARTSGDEALRARGSLTAFRGRDSNVVLPLGTGNEVASNESDQFWEARLAWADGFGDSPHWGYRLSGVMIEYDDQKDGNIGFAEAGIDYRGPISVQLGATALTVADSGYQRTTDLRVNAVAYNVAPFYFAFDLGYSDVAAIGDGPEQLEGSRYFLGGILGGRTRVFSGTLSLRRIYNDRELAALSPDQFAVGFDIRTAMWKGANGRVSVRYTDSDYPTNRDDELLELSGDLSFRIYKALFLILEATRYENRSSEPTLRYDTDKVYAGLRIQL